MLSDWDYKRKLEKDGLLDGAEKWLKRNPPPPGWRAGRYAWAYLEMPVLFGRWVLWWL